MSQAGDTMTDNGWWEAPSKQSKVKTDIVVEYFQRWAQVMAGSSRKYRSWPDRIAYVDLFAGRGFYKDDTPSTPLRVIQRAASLSHVPERIDIWLNDAEGKYYRELKRAVEDLAPAGELAVPAEVTNYEVSPAFVEHHVRPRPATLFFLDPWGYSGVSLDLIAKTVQAKGSECILFFNFNRINMGVSNELVTDHMVALFGAQRVASMAVSMEGLSSEQREETLMDQAHEALREIGGRYPLDFQFLNEDASKTSHYIIHVSSHLKGHTIMKSIMRNQSSPSDDGIATFVYDPVKHAQTRMKLFEGHAELASDLMQAFPADVPFTMDEVYAKHQFGTPYVPGDYKEALRQLEEAGRIIAEPPAEKRRKRKSQPTFADDVMVTFLPRGGD